MNLYVWNTSFSSMLFKKLIQNWFLISFIASWYEFCICTIFAHASSFLHLFQICFFDNSIFHISMSLLSQQQELSVRDVDYELIDAVCSIQWSLMFYTLYSRDRCRRKVIIVQRDQNNINVTTSQSLKSLFLAAIANVKEMNAIDIMNWCTQTAIACSNSLHSSLYMTWNARRSNNDMMNVIRMYEVTACKRLQKISNETHLYMMLTTNLLSSYSKV